MRRSPGSPPGCRATGAAGRLDGFPRHLSVHCGGVVIASGDVSRHVPVERAAKGVRVIQWEKDQAEEAGLVKIDLLGNRSLSVIRDACAAVREHGGPDLPYGSFDPIDDPRTQEKIRDGDTMGVFYVESPAMRQLQQKTRRGDFEHLVIHSSMIRPAANDYIREYVRRLRGGSYESIHPILGEVLVETYGIMCYQEDVAKVAMRMAGFSASEADGLRKVLARKWPGRRLEDNRQQFFRGARSRGVGTEVTQQVWEMILSFSGYSFCKPHSASYALVSFQSCYLKAHYPAEFIAAVISNQGGYYSTFAYVSEARRMGLTILPPDVNASERAYTGKGREVRLGLMQLKGLRQESLDALLAERARGGAFRSLADLRARVALRASDVELLVKAGAIDSIADGRTRPELLWELCLDGRATQPAPELFAAPPVAAPRTPAYDRQTVLRHEVETLGFLLSAHPLEPYERAMRGRGVIAARDLDRHAGSRVRILGWHVNSKLVQTRDKEPMEFIAFEDTTAIYDATLFPDAYRRFCHLLTSTRPFLLTGLVEEDFGVCSLTVEKVERL